LQLFIEEVFFNILELRECNRQLLERLQVRRREQGPYITGVGAILTAAATEFRAPYARYIGHLPLAEVRLRDETANNTAFQRFLKVIIVALVLSTTDYLVFTAGSSKRARTAHLS
jgi:hypothetical protein